VNINTFLLVSNRPGLRLEAEEDPVFNIENMKVRIFFFSPGCWAASKIGLDPGGLKSLI
jgi:hypothetical protein